MDIKLDQVDIMFSAGLLIAHGILDVDQELKDQQVELDNIENNAARQSKKGVSSKTNKSSKSSKSSMRHSKSSKKLAGQSTKDGSLFVSRKELQSSKERPRERENSGPEDDEIGNKGRKYEAEGGAADAHHKETEEDEHEQQQTGEDPQDDENMELISVHSES
jgi:hypothetical protein